MPSLLYMKQMDYQSTTSSDLPDLLLLAVPLYLLCSICTEDEVQYQKRP